MDPLAVVRILWRHKVVALPFVLMTVALFMGALFFGPRVYQATSSFAMITPASPSALEIENSPELVTASNNPYLRSADPTLVLQVGKTRLSSEDVTRTLVSEGLSTDFVVGTGLATSTQILTITADATDPDTAVRSAQRLGSILDEQIREVQLASGASDRYLITVQTINQAEGASERVSGRLRNAAVAGIGGMVLLVAAVSIARAVDTRAHPENPAAQSRPVAPGSAQATEAAPTRWSDSTTRESLTQRSPVPPPRPVPTQRSTVVRPVQIRTGPQRPITAGSDRRSGVARPSDPPHSAPRQNR